MTTAHVTDAEWRDMLEKSCQAALGHDYATFVARWKAGIYTWDEPPGATRVAMMAYPADLEAPR